MNLSTYTRYSLSYICCEPNYLADRINGLSDLLYCKVTEPVLYKMW